MLFKSYHVAPICAGLKTQTRRTSLRMQVKPGTVFTATTNYSKAGQFARLRCLRTWVEQIKDMTEADCRAELCANVDEYVQLYAKVNRLDPDVVPGMTVRAYEFELVKVL